MDEDIRCMRVVKSVFDEDSATILVKFYLKYSKVIFIYQSHYTLVIFVSNHPYNVFQDADIPSYAQVIFQYCQFDKDSGKYTSYTAGFGLSLLFRSIHPPDLHQLLHVI